MVSRAERLTAIEKNRRLDTAAYHDEQQVGEDIRAAMAERGVKREALFVSTKLWHDHRRYDRAVEAIEASLHSLDIGYTMPIASNCSFVPPMTSAMSPGLAASF